MTERLMPQRVDLGVFSNTSMGEVINRYEKWNEKWKEGEDTFPEGTRTVCGFLLPSWQRPLVWSEAQMVSFLESSWLGVPLGTYTYNLMYGSELDYLLVDGQQRLTAVQRYLDDELEVFGYRWSQVTTIDRRHYASGTFSRYRVETRDEAYLRNYYNLMNFGGTPHTEDQRA